MNRPKPAELLDAAVLRLAKELLAADAQREKLKADIQELLEFRAACWITVQGKAA